MNWIPLPHRVGSLLSVSASILLLTASWASAWERTFDFEKDKPPNPPKDLILEATADQRPLFHVQEEKGEDVHNRVLAMAGSTHFKNASLVALAWFSNLENGTVSADFMHTGEEDTIRRPGVIWRYQSASETYILECDTVKSVLRLILFSGGKRKILEDKRVEVPPGVWNHIQADFDHETIRCSFNGKVIFEKSDGSIKGEGKAGLYLDSNTQVLFDNFKVKGND